MNDSSPLESLLREQAERANEMQRDARELLIDTVSRAVDAGMTQRQISLMIERSQPEVSRLIKQSAESARARSLRANRSRVLAAARAHGFSNIRLFGSVARGEDGPDSDIDLLVEIPESTSLFSLGRFEIELAEILGYPVEVTPARSLKPHVSRRALAEARPL